MGQTATTSSPPDIAVRAVGTDIIEYVELPRWQPGTATFEVIRRWEPTALEFAGTYRDESHIPGAIYYVRLKQARLIRNRVVMAWSSPVWTKP